MVGRRMFLRTAAAGTAIAGLGDFSFLTGLRPVSAAEASLPADAVRFGSDIESLVRLIEDAPRETLLPRVADAIRDGRSYREVLAALLLAGVRNVQPRPSVGFKFHAVLVVNSAHLASLSSPTQDRWLPIFWALDYFKSAQARDVREGNWTMASVDESRVPSAGNARAMFEQAMQQWDVEAADVATAGVSRSAGANEVFELFARYGARDFRSIGHKAIFVANSWRTLQCIGWHHREPVLRSLAYALLNHQGDPNPAQSDQDADRPWRENLKRADSIRPDWTTGELDDDATRELVKTLRTGSSSDCSSQATEMLNRGVAPQSVFDALFLGAGEMLMRQPGIISLHAVTTTNALNYAFRTSATDHTRRMLLLQNAAFLPMFREAMFGRGRVGDAPIEELQPAEAKPEELGVDQIFTTLSKDRGQAARLAMAWLQNDGQPEPLMDAARRLIFVKGNDAHDYKFSSAVLEDVYHISPAWRSHFLSSSLFHLKGAGESDNQLVERIREALA